MVSSSLLILAVAILLTFTCSSEALPDAAPAVRMQKTIFLSKCSGRGRAVKLCRKKRNGFCRAIRCMIGKRRGFRCRCLALPSPSPIALPPNAPCTLGKSKCSSGHTCSCGGRCRKEVSLKIKAAGDDAIKIYTCGGKIASTPSFDKLAVIRYTGACDNIIIEATNLDRPPTQTNPVAVSVLVEMGAMRYGTKSDVDGVAPLDAVGTFEPLPGFELNEKSYDYSGWTPVVVVDFLKMFPNLGKLDAMGAQPVCTSPDSAAAGTYAFRIDAPYC